MHDQAAVAIDAALIAVKKTFMDRDKDLEAWKQFPPSRALRTFYKLPSRTFYLILLRMVFSIQMLPLRMLW